MNVRIKLIVLVALLIAALTGSSILAVTSIREIADQAQELRKLNELQRDMKQVQFLLAGLANDERGYLLTGEAEFTEEMQTKMGNLNKLLQSMAPPLKDKYGSAMQEIERSLSNLFQLNGEMVRLRSSGSVQKAKTVHFKQERSLRKQKVNPAVENVVKLLAEEAAPVEIHIKENSTRSQTILLTVSILSVILGSAASVLLLRIILKPLRLLNEQMIEITAGEADLTKAIQIAQKDEFGMLAGSFNAFVASLRDIVRKVGETTDHLASVSQQFFASVEQSRSTSQLIAESMQTIADRASEQNRLATLNAKQTRESLDRIESISHHSSDMASASLSMHDQADLGERTIAQTGEKMNDIKQAVDEADSRLTLLSEQTVKIAEITSLINEISEQTHLLALNASIEAARAGEAGRGFHVVAEEVKKLARHSAKSAKEIRELIGNIRENANMALTSMTDVKARTAEGNEIMTHSVNQFREILQSISEVSGKTSEISDSAQLVCREFTVVSQSMETVGKGTSDISAGTQEIAAATQEQLASGEEMRFAAESLNDMAGNLQSLISRFKV
ncbi:methyl-accepting chemotaxis protein [Paenibacillus rhizophilus]|uniref:Methyl-accepting chemotaxis protein n=1 Tax=Paenibacillus rhizophilus TaxID=1850366 RepID=A0A3N9PCV5_9BACL|nr:methyl-accepting chemotaxis protein [Paenibacillus rhizophilus]RQW13719.1 methyl-accepting chemotaxis protein [Paenibacillus rhizophilus]